MKVKCINTGFAWIKYGEVYDVIRETVTEYVVQTPNGERRYFKYNFEVVSNETLEEKLKEAKNEVARIEALIEKENAVKVGDTFVRNDKQFILTEIIIEGTRHYALVVTKSDYNYDVGRTWDRPKTDIKKVFGLQSQSEFKKLKSL